MSEDGRQITQTNHGESCVQIGQLDELKVDKLVVHVPRPDGWDKLRGFVPDDLIDWARQQSWTAPVSPWLFALSYFLGFIDWSTPGKKVESRVDWTTWAMAITLTLGVLYGLFIVLLLLFHKDPTGKWAAFGMASSAVTLALMTAIEFMIVRPWRIANLVTATNNRQAPV